MSKSNEQTEPYKSISNLTSKAKLQKLAKSFQTLHKKKTEKREREILAWQTLVKNAIQFQKGKIPLLLAVEAGNQSMCRELLSAQTAEQLRVIIPFILNRNNIL